MIESPTSGRGLIFYTTAADFCEISIFVPYTLYMSTPHAGVYSRASGFAHPHTNVSVMGIHPGMKVADFGAGSGAYVLAVAQALSGSGVVYAIDIQKDLLRRIANEAKHKHYNTVEIIWADLEEAGASKLAPGIIDIVIMSNLLFQLRDKMPPLREARRILKSTGKLIIIDWTDSFGGLGPRHDDVVLKAEALDLALKAGFEIGREFEAGAHHYGLICRIPGQKRRVQ